MDGTKSFDGVAVIKEQILWIGLPNCYCYHWLYPKGTHWRSGSVKHNTRARSWVIKRIYVMVPLVLSQKRKYYSNFLVPLEALREISWSFKLIILYVLVKYHWFNRSIWYPVRNIMEWRRDDSSEITKIMIIIITKYVHLWQQWKHRKVYWYKYFFSTES